MLTMMHPAMNIMPGVESMPSQHQSTNNNISAPNKQLHVKRPVNAFILWSRAERSKLALVYPKMPSREVNKIAGALWKKMSDKEKRPFVDKAEELRQQHKKDHPDFKYPRRKSKIIMKPNDLQVASYSTTDNCALSNHFDSKNFMHSPQLCAYETEAKVNCTAASKSPYGLPFASQPPTASYCPEYKQFKSTCAYNFQSPNSSAYQASELMSPTQNPCGQDVNRSDFVHSSPSSSPTMYHSSQKFQQSVPYPSHMQAQSMVSQEQTSVAHTYLTVPEINSESSSNSLTFDSHAFSFFPTSETKSSFNRSILSTYETTDTDYGAWMHASQTSSPTSESPSSGRILEHVFLNHTARSVISIPNSNSLPGPSLTCMQSQSMVSEVPNSVHSFSAFPTTETEYLYSHPISPIHETTDIVYNAWMHASPASSPPTTESPPSGEIEEPVLYNLAARSVISMPNSNSPPGPFPTCMQSQTVVSEVPNSVHSFSTFPTIETECLCIPPISPIHETADVDYSTLMHVSQTSSPPTSESPSGGIEESVLYNLTARSVISMPNSNSPPGLIQSQTGVSEVPNSSHSSSTFSTIKTECLYSPPILPIHETTDISYGVLMHAFQTSSSPTSESHSSGGILEPLFYSLTYLT